jgi:hypothetical protein
MEERMKVNLCAVSVSVLLYYSNTVKSGHLVVHSLDANLLCNGISFTVAVCHVYFFACHHSIKSKQNYFLYCMGFATFLFLQV